jgi:dipeptidyl aminopeptidase/acylaminoacyl peptidase
MLPLGGSGRATNLTQAIGERDKVRFRVIRLDESSDDEGIDTSRPMLLSAYGERTRKSGYWTVTPGQAPRALIWEDRMIGGVRKAENADRVIFTAQTFEEFPDFYVANATFQNPRRVTHANPQRAEFAWGRRVLVDYTDARGNQLQATLALPAGYVEGRRYPMLVYFYEKMSQRHHEFSLPVYDDRPHMSTYASDGYLVLMPDIVYTDGQPGSSALDDVTSAVRRVIELGYADPERIGLQGHSWGGYESSFVVTQTDMFAAVVTGAPLTNLESMHNILYKSSGGGNAPLIQWGQGRMATVPWQDPEGYASQSPVRHVENIRTPFLILHGTADGAVDWNQGLEFYVAARRAGKEVILLSYPDEPHHLSREANQKDFQRRMKQYFDHYLKGAPAADWMTRGLPFLDRGRVVTESGASR